MGTHLIILVTGLLVLVFLRRLTLELNGLAIGMVNTS